MRNPLIPYAIIAVLGIIVVIIISFVGVSQREAIQNPENENTGEEASLDPEEIFANSCASCHGDDMSGSGDAPDLTQVGNRLDEDEIIEIINEGRGSMPPGTASPEEAEVIAEWLAEQE